MKWNEARHGPQKPAARDGRLTSSAFGFGWESIQQVGNGTGFISSSIGQVRFSLKIIEIVITSCDTHPKSSKTIRYLF